MSVNNLVSSNTMSSVKNIFQLTKNSGETVVFNENKLKASIVAALRSAGIEDNPISNQLVDEVIKKLGEELNYRENITTLDVREAVEIAFLERGLTKAAQDYHDYDKKNKEVEDLQIFFEENKDIIEKVSVGNTAEIISDKKSKKLSESVKKEQDLKQLSSGEKKLVVEEKIDPPELGEVKSIKSKSKELSHQDSKRILDKNDKKAIIHKFNFNSASGFFLVVLSEIDKPEELVVTFSIDNLSSQDKIFLNLFTRLVSIAWRNKVSLVDLFNDQEQLQFDFSQASSDADRGILPIIKYLINWLSEKFS